ncbi:MAG: accessory gene regulator B family protein [Lachnospiraceae bacterium]|nr:accessory gene regulator B family protein [Lachnospiraceae bacterium]
MNTLKEYLKKNNYYPISCQPTGKDFFYRWILPFLSKLLIIGILFFKHLDSCLIALLIMSILRYSTGGIYLSSYLGSLAATLFSLWLSICLLPHIILPKYMQLFLLLVGMEVCYSIGPVTCKNHPLPTAILFTRGRSISCILIFIFSAITFIAPQTHCLDGFWIIILHILQLIGAKFLYTKKKFPS